MTFAAFGAAMVLAAFLVASAMASLAVAASGRPAMRALAACPPERRARLLFALRVSPAAVSLPFALGLVAPAYVLLEPTGTGEKVTGLLGMLAAGGGAVMVAGLVRSVRSWWATRSLVRRWMRDAEPVRLAGCPVPAYRIRDEFPVFSVVGVGRTRIYVARQVLGALTSSEVSAALAHESAHLAAGDNVKRWLLRSCPDLLALLPFAREIEEAWARASEAAADTRAAAGNSSVALDLAAGILKVARLAPPGAAALPITALHGGGDIASRVERLTAGSAPDRPEVTGRGRLALVLVVLSTLAAVPVLLPAVHRLIEDAARLLR